MDAPRWLNQHESRAWRGYTRLRVELQARLARDLAACSGLSEADYDVLVHLSEAPDGRLRHFQLGDALQWHRSRLSHQLTRMTKRGLLTKEACTTDARGGFVVLTPTGLTAIEAAAPAHVDAVRRYLLDALDETQLAALADITETVLAHLDPGTEQVA